MFFPDRGRILFVLLATLLAAIRLDAAPSAESGAPFLWRMLAPGARHASWLFGTIHLSSPSVTRLRPSVRRALRSVDLHYGELLLDRRTGRDMLAEMEARPGESLLAVLPRDLSTQAEGELRRIDPRFRLQQFDHIKVWGLAMLILSAKQHESAGRDVWRGRTRPTLDEVLAKEAQRLGKKLGAIEYVPEQAVVFDEQPLAEQIRFLRQVLDARDPFGALRLVYLSGDLGLVDRLLGEQRPGFFASSHRKRFEAALFSRRNAVMARRIESLVRGAPGSRFFFAVGVGHFPGRSGLLRLLGARGFRLERVLD